MKLRGKITALYLVFVFVIIAIIGIVSFLSQRNAIDEMTESNLSGLTAAYAHDIGDQFNNYEQIINVIGHDELLYGDYTDAEKVNTISEYATAFGFVSGNILDLKGVSLADGTDFSDREYVQKALQGEINISSMSQSKLTGNYGCSIAGPLYNATGEICGVVYLRMEITQLLDIIASSKVSENSYSFIINNEGVVICHENQDLINAIDVSAIGMTDQLDDMIALEQGSLEYVYNNIPNEAGYSVIDHTDGWILISAAPHSDFTGPIQSFLKQFVIVEVIAILLSIITASILAQYLTKPITQIKNTLVKLSQGEFDCSTRTSKGKDEISQLINASDSLHKSLTGLFAEAEENLGKMAQYDLTANDMSEYPGEFNDFAHSINQIKSILNAMIKNIQETVANVGVGAEEIADATNALSQGTISQASSIQQVVADIENVANQTEKNSENGNLVNDKLQHLDELIKSSNEEMAELREAVLEIEEMSGDIQKIVNDIDSISFQTNILALNASVEAARAGDNGKGFAVVADEVGNLANKSSESSKKTSELIEKCISSINKAKKCADKTFASLHEIVNNSDEISNAFAEITEATEEQAENTKSIRGEVTKISDVVQTNTATAQQTAASTQVLSGEAENLGQLIRKFKV